MFRWIAIALLILMCGATHIQGASAESSATPIANTDQNVVDIRVMTFNVWLGGIQVDIGKVVEAIQEAGADVVGMQEAEGNEGRIAAALGWQYVDIRHQVISRYPLVDPSGSDGIYLYVEPRPGQVFALANLHLPSDPYGPYLARDGSSLDDILANELSVRMPAAKPYLDTLPSVVGQGMPVVVTGDFNSPSHLDWTSDAVAANDQWPLEVSWPVSEAFGQAGFLDTFRQANPDPVTAPGMTWTAGYPSPFVRQDEVFDRIDWVLASSGVVTLDSHVVGEPENPAVDIEVDPWPSDHRAVVSTLQIQLGTPPPYVAVSERSVSVGDPIVVRYQTAGVGGETISVVPNGGTVAEETIQSLAPQESFVAGSMMLGSGLLSPGSYDVVLVSESGSDIARTTFWVSATGAVPTLTVDVNSITSGQPITVSWFDSPGYKWDWLGVYAAEDSDLYNYLGFAYTGATVSGSRTLDEATFGGPLDPGHYVIRLMRDDGYVILASVTFEVR